MPALFDVPGTVLCAVQFPGEAATYLGTSIVTPEYEGVVSWLPIMNDLAGRSVPAANLYDGEIHRVSLVMNNIDYALYRRLRDQPTHTAGADNVGLDPSLDRGVIVTNKYDVRIIFLNSFFGTANATVNTPGGRMYYSVLLTGYKEAAPGTRVTEIAMLLECHSIMVAEGSNRKGFALYTENPLLFPTFPIIGN